jgi:hypothetical protein
MAVLFSVVSSCQRHGHDPFVYLRDVLSRHLFYARTQKARLMSLPPVASLTPGPVHL